MCHFARTNMQDASVPRMAKKPNKHCIYNEILLLFPDFFFNQSMNDEYMNDIYKTNIYFLYSSLRAKTMVPR